MAFFAMIERQHMLFGKNASHEFAKEDDAIIHDDHSLSLLSGGRGERRRIARRLRWKKRGVTVPALDGVVANFFLAERANFHEANPGDAMALRLRKVLPNLASRDREERLNSERHNHRHSTPSFLRRSPKRLGNLRISKPRGSLHVEVGHVLEWPSR
jgi:hypothetical protein